PSLARVLLRPPPPPAAPALHSFPPRCSSALPPRPCLVRRPAPTLPRPSSVSPSVSEGPVVMWPARTPERRVELRMSGRSGALVRSEEHTSELQSRQKLVCRLLRETQPRTPRR